MNMKQVECFIALAETLNFSRAADLCYVSQSAFSRLISSMESELECTLLARSKVHPRLTQAGEQIYEHAKQILYHSSEMQNIARIYRKGELGNFKVAILEKGLTCFCVNLIRGYQEKCPSVDFDFQECSENELVKVLVYQQHRILSPVRKRSFSLY